MMVNNTTFIDFYYFNRKWLIIYYFLDIIINKLNEKSEQFQVEETYDLPSNTNTSFSGNIDKHNQGK